MEIDFYEQYETAHGERYDNQFARPSEEVFKRAGLFAAYFRAFEHVKINSSSSVKIDDFNAWFRLRFNRSYTPLNFETYSRLAPSRKNAEQKYQLIGKLYGTGQFAGRGITIQEARDNASVYIFDRLNRLYKLFKMINTEFKRDAVTTRDSEYLKRKLDVTFPDAYKLKSYPQRQLTILTIPDCRQFEVEGPDSHDRQRDCFRMLVGFAHEIDRHMTILDGFPA